VNKRTKELTRANKDISKYYKKEIALRKKLQNRLRLYEDKENQLQNEMAHRDSLSNTWCMN
jgi:hypothetical protein